MHKLVNMDSQITRNLTLSCSWSKIIQLANEICSETDVVKKEAYKKGFRECIADINEELDRNREILDFEVLEGFLFAWVSNRTSLHCSSE